MTWHYQLMLHKDTHDGVEYPWIGLHEMYGEHGYTDTPDALVADSKEEMLEQLEMIKNDILKYGVIDYND